MAELIVLFPVHQVIHKPYVPGYIEQHSVIQCQGHKTLSGFQSWSAESL